MLGTLTALIRFSTFGGLLILIGLGITAGCSEERSLTPVPVNYRFYVAMKHPTTHREAYLLSIDCETDSIVDSLYLSGLTDDWKRIYASPSSPIIVVPHEGVHKVYDPQRREFLLSFDYSVGGVEFFPDLGRLVVALPSTLVYEDTTYTLRTVIEPTMSNCKRVGRTSRIIAQSHYGRSARFLIADVMTGAVVDSFQIGAGEENPELSFVDFETSPDGTRIYMVAIGDQGAGLIGYDLIERKLLFWYPHIGQESLGSCFINPKGDEVWATWGTNMWGVAWPTSVHILDAFSGVLLDTIDLSPTNIGWPHYTSPTQVRFVPNQPKAYVSCGTRYTGPQPVVVVNTDNRQIEEILFTNSGRFPRQTAMGLGW